MATSRGRSHPLAPVGEQPVGELVQPDDAGRLGLQHGLDGGSQVEAVGASAEEAGPMAGVLHPVGEGQQLLVPVERRLVQVADDDRRQAGRLGADERQGKVGLAGRAAVRVLRAGPLLKWFQTRTGTPSDWLPGCCFSVLRASVSGSRYCWTSEPGSDPGKK